MNDNFNSANIAPAARSSFGFIKVDSPHQCYIKTVQPWSFSGEYSRIPEQSHTNDLIVFSL